MYLHFDPPIPLLQTSLTKRINRLFKKATQRNKGKKVKKIAFLHPTEGEGKFSKIHSFHIPNIPKSKITKI